MSDDKTAKSSHHSKDGKLTVNSFGSDKASNARDIEREDAEDAYYYDQQVYQEHYEDGDSDGNFRAAKNKDKEKQKKSSKGKSAQPPPANNPKKAQPPSVNNPKSAHPPPVKDPNPPKSSSN